MSKVLRMCSSVVLAAALSLAVACSGDSTGPSADQGAPSNVELTSLTPVLLVNTGAGGTSVGPVIAAGETEFPDWQFLAGQITLAYESDLTSVAGWMKVFAGGSVTVHIRANTSGLPGASLYSASYTKTTTADFQWVSFDNFNTTLAAGTYWVTFEPPFNGGFIGSMARGAPQPLAQYAYLGRFTGTWGQNFGATPPALGFQVTGVEGPAQAIADLEASIATYNLAKGTATSLTSKLDLALAAFGVDDVASACAYLADAINYTNAQTGKRIPASTAASILSDLAAIRSDLSC